MQRHVTRGYGCTIQDGTSRQTLKAFYRPADTFENSKYKSIHQMAKPQNHITGRFNRLTEC